MKNLYYATRIDKNGNKLTASYTNDAMRKKYGGADAEHMEDVVRVEFHDGQAVWGEKDGSGYVVRGILHNAKPPVDDELRFVLFGKLNGRWMKTPFSFEQYGTANSTMKSMIGQYQSMMIVDQALEDEDEEEAPKRSFTGDDDSPF